jgi:hypothetical protein
MANHVVNALKFEIKVANKSNFDEVAEEIPYLTKTGIAELIDQVLSELYPSKNLLVINKLEIDLGSLRLSHLKVDLLKKFEGEFKIAIKQHLESSMPQFTSAGELPFIILNDYIQRGTRPKWLTTSEGSFQDHISKAFSKNPKKFANQVKGYLKNPTQKKRLLDNFPEEILVESVLVDYPHKPNDSNEEFAQLKTFFREQYRHLDAQSVSVMFKSIVLDILMNSQRINQQRSFRSAVMDALENRFGSEVASSYQLRMPNSSNPILLESAVSTRNGAKEGTRALPGSGVAREELLEKFQFFLLHGYIVADSRSSSYRYRNINTLFDALLVQDWDGLVAFLLTYGKSQAIKKRFLDSLSQEAILAFFSKVAPQKRKLLEWVVDVFEQVQEVYKPINQTVIQVKKSVNEITFELFLNKNLQSTSDENYLRLLFKKTALKYGISYKNLLFITLKSISTGEKKYRIFNFNQMLGGLYAKDILKRKGYTPIDLLLFSTDEKEQEWRTNYQNKEELVSLFGGLYQDQYGSLPAAVVAWLQTKLQTLPLTNASRLFELWEEFSQKYTLPLGELVIPLLLEKKSNARVKLNSTEFDFWVKKYGIQGIYPTKEVDVLQLLTYLQSNKKMVSPAMIKKIVLALPVTGSISKQVFFKVAELIRPRFSAVLPEYLEWIQQHLKKNKAEKLEIKLYTWLYHQLIMLPQSQLSLASLKEKAEEFLSLSEQEAPREEEKTLSSVSSIPVVQKRKQLSNSAKMVARLFGILGLEEIYGIFPQARRYNEEILLKLLTTKYSRLFYQLVLTHRYNPEFQDAILAQAPNWLKKQVLDFLIQRSSFDWNASISALISYFEETKWIKLDGMALESFIEKILWKEIFEGGSFAKDEVVVELLGNALDARFISAKFWKDLQGYSQKRELQKESISTKAFLNFASLEQADGFSYLIARGGFKKEEPSILPILESLVYYSAFPVAHTFEGSSSEEFNDYITRLAVENKNEFLTFFERVKYPFFSRRFFNLVKNKGLLILIKEKHRQERIAISVEQVERILKIFTIQDPGKTEFFLRAWLVFLFHSTTRTRSVGYLAAEVGELLVEEGLWETRKLDLEATYVLLTKLFSWKEAEKKYFFNLARGWALVESIPAPILELDTEEQIQAYFKQVNDPNLKDLKGKAFLKIWFKLFFGLASTVSVTTFLELFKNSFYKNSYSLVKQQELFFKGFLQIKEGYASFQQALADSPQGWIEFRQDSPTFFEQYDQEVAPEPIKMSFVALLNFYLAYGVLPKEEGSLQVFIKKLMGKNGAELIQLRRIVLASLLNTKKKKILINLLRYVDEKWFYDLLHPKLSIELEKLVEEVKRKTGSNFFADLRIQQPVDRILFFAESLTKGGAATKHLVALLMPVFEQWVERKSPSVVAAMFTSSDEKPEVLVLIQHASRKVKKVLEEQIEKKQGEEPPKVIEVEEVNLGEGVSISNAGMVLCWPFFGRFFAALGLVEQGKFKGQKAEERAVQLLQYLATGLTSFEEWDLSLNKILCGVSLNTPISPTLELTLEEDELVRKLINGTIFNWEKIRGTKLETFRETFLVRQGMLYEKDNRWELIVERKAYDVLMDTLNWNISMINLGWMKKRLNVQWK